MNNAISDPAIASPALESSVGITEMYWEQAQSEDWCLIPLSDVSPSVQMLTEQGYVIPKNIYDDRSYPPSRRDNRARQRSHSCLIKFDRRYVIWWFGQQLQDLIDVDDMLIFDIALECGIPETSTFLQESSPDDKLILDIALEYWASDRNL